MSRKRIARRHRIVRTNGQKIAWTNTSAIPDAELVAAIKLVASEIDLDRTVVHCKAYHGGSNWGRAYAEIPWEANLAGLDPREWSFLVIVRDHRGWVNTLGHEAKHVEQFRRGTFRRERRARNCEAQAKAFGGWIADKWEAARA